MAIFHGKGGSISWAGSGLESKTQVLSWSAESTADIAEATDMGDTWKTYLPGFLDWTATAEFVADDTEGTVIAVGTSGNLTLEMVDGSENIEGNAICTGHSYSVDMNDVGKISAAFQGSGALAFGNP